MRDELIEGHRRIEAELNAILADGRLDLDAFRRAVELLREYYPREEQFLETLHPRAARKIARQHAEALEIAAAIEGPDAVYLSRRFIAIVQHTIIEVERDLFPLAESG